MIYQLIMNVKTILKVKTTQTGTGTKSKQETFEKS